MRILLIILSFVLTQCSKSQVLLFGGIAAAPEPTGIGTFIEDEFPGSTLSSEWNVNNPGLQTTSVSGGELRVTGNNGSDLSPALRISNTGWGHSMIRNYVIETEFHFYTTGKGIYIGVKSQHPVASSSTYGCIDVTAGRLKIFGGNGSDQFDNLPANQVSTVTINNSSDYYMKLEVNEDACTMTLTNLTLGQTQIVTFSYGFLLGNYNNLLRPNIFWYSFGVSGNTDAGFKYVKVSTTEKQNPKYVFFGNSITTGYFGGLATNCFPYKLRPHTADDLQVMAGGGCNMDDFLNEVNEIIYINPQFCFLMLGANDAGNFAAAWPKYQSIVNSLQAEGITVIHLPIVNGGNPNTSGLFNNLIKTAYPSTFIDVWTTGWNTMSVGSGDMADALHPTNQGHIKLGNIILAARPDLFPL